LTGLPSLAWSNRKSSLDRLEREESRLAIRGNPQNRFARKSHSKGQNLANSITCARPVIQPIQWFLNFSRTTNDPEYWRKLAAKRRALAGPVKDEKSKQLMLEIAEDFDRLAKRVEATRSTQ